MAPGGCFAAAFMALRFAVVLALQEVGIAGAGETPSPTQATTTGSSTTTLSSTTPMSPTTTTAPTPATTAVTSTWEDVKTWDDSDGTTHYIYKVEAVVCSFGIDAQKAYDPAGQRSNGKQLGSYTDESNGGTYTFDDSDGNIYMLRNAVGMAGNDVDPNLIIEVLPSDAMIVN